LAGLQTNDYSAYEVMPCLSHGKERGEKVCGDKRE